MINNIKKFIVKTNTVFVFRAMPFVPNLTFPIRGSEIYFLAKIKDITPAKIIHNPIIELAFGNISSRLTMQAM